MMKLWGRANSSNVMKAIWLLEELGLPYERIDVGGPFGGTTTPEYRAMNPLGVIPSLQEPDGFTLFESNVILRYLCRAHAPGTALYPNEVPACATIESWMEFQQTAHNRPGSVVFQGMVRVAPEKRDHGAIAAAVAELGSIWSILNNRLGLHDYVVGQTFTLADITFGVHVHRWFNMAITRPDLPHLFAWYERLLARPAYLRHCAGAIT